MSDKLLPKKKFSQNFLTDLNIARKIVKSLHVGEGDTVVEIGCGQGALTRWLLEEPCHLHGIEVDRSLIPILREQFGTRAGFTLHEADVLEFDPVTLDRGNAAIKLIGNLPYHISSPILFRLMEWRTFVNQAVFMVQKEVAQRIVCRPGSRDYSLLSVFCQYHASCAILFDVPPAAFYPRPRVTSSVIDIRPREYPVIPRDYSVFRAVVKRSFNQRRKMLRNSLATFLHDRTIAFDLQQRPEQLSVDDFVKLADLLTPSNAHG